MWFVAWLWLGGCFAGAAPMALERTAATSGGEPVPVLAGPGAGGRAGEVGGQVQVRTGSVSLAVDAYDPARKGLVDWVTAHGGHLSDETTSRTDGRASYGTLRVRVPADQLDPLLGWIGETFEVQRVEVHRVDVTAEWVDLGARLHALRTSEQRLLELTAGRTAGLQEVLAAETELARIRGEIESIEGRQRVLGDQVELATLDVAIAVRDPYAPLVAETLRHEVVRAFAGSLGAMATAGRGLVVLGAAATPWLALLGLGLGGIVAAARRTARR